MKNQYASGADGDLEVFPNSNPTDFASPVHTDEERRSVQLKFLIPVYNDWEAVTALLPRLDSVLKDLSIFAGVLIVDDGSSELENSAHLGEHVDKIEQIEILRLVRNLGHQRAICIGLAHLAATTSDSSVVVMDANGEDDPNDLPRLLGALQEERYKKIIFAERTKRSEGLVFTSFYAIYRWLHICLVGHRVRVGNYSVIPARHVRTLSSVSELWAHYAASVFVSKIPYRTIPTKRGSRICGTSKMNFVNLVLHGLGALAVFSERIGVRLLCAVSVLVAVIVIAMLGVVGIRLFTTLAIPGWATTALGGLGNLLLQLFIAAILFCFLILSRRISAPFIPARDHKYYIGSLDTMIKKEASRT